MEHLLKYLNDALGFHRTLEFSFFQRRLSQHAISYFERFQTAVYVVHMVIIQLDGLNDWNVTIYVLTFLVAVWQS